MLKLPAIFLALCIPLTAFTQDSQPQVRVNYLNVCSPSETEQREIAAALSAATLKPVFDVEFEVARGRSVMSDATALTRQGAVPVSNWVRVRRELTPNSAIQNAQYSFSVDEKGMTETLALRARDAAKSGFLQISIQDSVTSGTPEQVLSANTPADRIRIERSGKSSLVLARCPGALQADYEPLFSKGSEIMRTYRSSLDVRRTVEADLARLRTKANARARSTSIKKK